MKNTLALAKPSRHEEDYFVRLEIELRRSLATQRQAEMELEAREAARALHFMKCPKCGMQLEEISLADVRIDKCFGCQGLWLDAGELDTISAKESGFMQRVWHAFHP
jgi:uncharacterized protein